MSVRGWLRLGLLAALVIGAFFFGVYRGKAANPAGDEFYLKVLHVDRGKGELEAELTTPPKKTKILFSGEIGEVFDGEFVKFHVRKEHWNFGGKEMKVQRVTWVF